VKRFARCCIFTIIVSSLLPASAQQRSVAHGKLFPPENLPELEGPDRDIWQRPEQVMDALNIAEGDIVADLGAASGWFTIRLARRVGPNGRVYAEDIQREMVEVIKRRLPRENVKNVETSLGTADDPKLPIGQLDAVLMVYAYHEMERPVLLLRNAARALKPDGRLGIVEFTKDGGGPGPPMDERVDPERVIREANEAGLRLISRPNILRYQYMLVFAKSTPDAPTGGRATRDR
jgi:ubiquinone/menaquinone biosynthesis C-methylase UbiE